MGNILLQGPVPPENNPPINPQYYSPRVFVITAITLGVTTTVTTALDVNLVIGQLVRLLIPQFCGCTALDEQTGYIISIPEPNQVVVNINSLGLNVFVSTPSNIQPQLVPIGDINTGSINLIPSTEQTYISGSFINISPL